MRSEETSAGNATLLTPAPSSLLGRAKVLKSAKKVNRNGQSEVHHPRRCRPRRRRRVTSSIGADAAIAVCHPVSKSFFHTAARCVMRQRGSSERCPFFTPPRSPSSSLSSSLLHCRRQSHVLHSVAAAGLAKCTRPSACRSPSVAKWNLCVTAARSRRQLRTKRRNNISATKGDAPMLRRPRGSDGLTGRSLIAAFSPQVMFY